MIDWQKTAKENKKKYAHFLKRCEQRKIIKALPDLHQETFAKIDCLQCANCCKNHSPRFKIPDIKRIAKFLHMKQGDFIQKYLILVHFWAKTIIVKFMQYAQATVPATLILTKMYYLNAHPSL